MLNLIIALIAIILVAFFSVQNAAPVVISFFFWRFEASLAVVIFLSALAGILITIIIYSSRSVKKALSARKSHGDPATKIAANDQDIS